MSLQRWQWDKQGDFYLNSNILHLHYKCLIRCRSIHGQYKFPFTWLCLIKNRILEFQIRHQLEGFYSVWQTPSMQTAVQLPGRWPYFLVAFRIFPFHFSSSLLALLTTLEWLCWWGHTQRRRVLSGHILKWGTTLPLKKECTCVCMHIHKGWWLLSGYTVYTMLGYAHKPRSRVRFMFSFFSWTQEKKT